jgi:hypothetical protein
MIAIRLGVVTLSSLENPISGKIAFAMFHLAQDSVEHSQLQS